MCTPVAVCRRNNAQRTAAISTITTGIGIPNRRPRPKIANMGSETVTDFASVRIFGIDAEMPKVAKVTIKGGILPQYTIAPLNSPTPTPTSMAMRAAAHQGTPDCIAIAAMTPVKAMLDPTDRSIPPVSSTKVWPKAKNNTTEPLRKSTSRLSKVRKAGEMIPMMIPTARTTPATPSSCGRRNFFISLTPILTVSYRRKGH